MNAPTPFGLPSVKRAFISHSGPDDRYVAEFVQLVRSLGFEEVFNDSHTIEPDAEFWERIEQGIRDCDAFVVILSRASVKSSWVDKEVVFARQLGKRVIPIRIDNCQLPTSFDGRDVIELQHGGRGQRLSSPRFLHHAAELFLGREPELQRLDAAWADGVNVLCLIAWGGVGKTSLMAEWVQSRFIHKQWKDADGQPSPMAYFDWSFYDQGTGSLDDGTRARTGNVGDFFEQALIFFGDREPHKPGKGSRLADYVRQQRTLFILDGLEPLQQPVGHPQAGRLLDADLREFLCALAASNPGLCVVTSRQPVTDVHGRAAQSVDLEDLPKSVAVRLLRQMQITGSEADLEAASVKFGCHALSLTLLGRFLVDAHGGDIRRIDRVNLHRADDLTREERHRTAWKVLESYDHWLATAQADGHPRTLAVLRLVGLFDRTATPDCLAVLRAEPVIPGLTESICGMLDDEWNILLKRLDRAHLIKLRQFGSPPAFGIDAHPLVREYFAHQLKSADSVSRQASAVRLTGSGWRTAHERLFRHLCDTTQEGDQPQLEDLQPLYQAVSHGCQAGLQQAACDEVFSDRIQRGREAYSTKKLGALGSDLGAVACFFETPWSRVSPALTAPDQAWLLNEAASRLRAVGRLTEALEPLRAALEMLVKQEDWKNAAQGTSNLSELELTLGAVAEAVRDAELAVTYADRSRDAFQRIGTRTTHADARRSMGFQPMATPDHAPSPAETLFREAEQMQLEDQPHYPLLYSLQGFRYCELLLAAAERAAWQRVLASGGRQPSEFTGATRADSSEGLRPPLAGDFVTECQAVAQRAAKMFEWHVPSDSLLDIALDHLTLGRAALYSAMLSGTGFPPVIPARGTGDGQPPGPESHFAGPLGEAAAALDPAVSGLRLANRQEFIPRGLLTRAWLR